MSGFIIHEGALVTCPHTTGQASPDQVDTRVSVSGQAIMTLTRTYTITGCPQSTPCSKASWISGAHRVTASGFPVAIHNGQSVCIPLGSLKPQLFQQRAAAD
jgi:hypothetical protein